MLKLVKRKLDIYKLMIKEILLVTLLKTFAKRKILLLVMWQHICRKKTR